jgi:hypothetical protein
MFKGLFQKQGSVNQVTEYEDEDAFVQLKSRNASKSVKASKVFIP